MIVAKVLEDPETEELLQNASGGGPALDALLERHRNRLRRMVAVRLDSRLAPLVNPSDVVQGALADASRKLDWVSYVARRFGTSAQNARRSRSQARSGQLTSKKVRRGALEHLTRGFPQCR